MSSKMEIEKDESTLILQQPCFEQSPVAKKKTVLLQNPVKNEKMISFLFSLIK
ncbi:MAG: hypothetical protein ACOX50_01665 [Patescibacteria group bacterium]